MTDVQPTVAPDISVLAGDPDEREFAAIAAVLSGVLDELAAEQGRRELAGPSAWERSQRALRGPLTPGHGQWRGFSA